MPHQNTTLSLQIKKFTPYISRLACAPRFAGVVRLADMYLALLQGKGGGGVWQFNAESVAAAAKIHTQIPVLFDVGANRGGWSKDISEILGEERKPRLFLFEPSAECNALMKNMGLPNATFYQAAVGDIPGEATMFVPDSTSTVSSLHKRRDSFIQHLDFTEVKVKVVTIDEVVEKEHLQQIDFMKMDVEGHELSVLKGARKSLESGMIKALSFEFGAPNLNSRTFFFDFWDLLRPLGYQFLRITPGGCLLPVEEYYEDLEYFRACANYIAFKE